MKKKGRGIFTLKNQESNPKGKKKGKKAKKRKIIYSGEYILRECTFKGKKRCFCFDGKGTLVEFSIDKDTSAYNNGKMDNPKKKNIGKELQLRASNQKRSFFFSGNFKNGKYNGQGTLRSKTISYSGGWKHGKKQGLGTIIFNKNHKSYFQFNKEKEEGFHTSKNQEERPTMMMYHGLFKKNEIACLWNEKKLKKNKKKRPKLVTKYAESPNDIAKNKRYFQTRKWKYKKEKNTIVSYCKYWEIINWLDQINSLKSYTWFIKKQFRFVSSVLEDIKAIEVLESAAGNVKEHNATFLSNNEIEKIFKSIQSKRKLIKKEMIRNLSQKGISKFLSSEEFMDPNYQLKKKIKDIGLQKVPEVYLLIFQFLVIEINENNERRIERKEGKDGKIEKKMFFGRIRGKIHVLFTNIEIINDGNISSKNNNGMMEGIPFGVIKYIKIRNEKIFSFKKIKELKCIESIDCGLSYKGIKELVRKCDNKTEDIKNLHTLRIGETKTDTVSESFQIKTEFWKLFNIKTIRNVIISDKIDPKLLNFNFAFSYNAKIKFLQITNIKVPECLMISICTRLKKLETLILRGCSIDSNHIKIIKEMSDWKTSILIDLKYNRLINSRIIINYGIPQLFPHYKIYYGDAGQSTNDLLGVDDEEFENETDDICWDSSEESDDYY